jgi:hypothetical protein
MMNKLFTIISVLIISSCATIEEYEKLTQETNVPLSTSVNGVIFKIKKEKDLPNAFGRADIYGGKVDQGEKVLRYMGLNSSGNMVLRITDIDIKSNETVFTRYNIPRVISNNNTNSTPQMTGGWIGGQGQTNQPQVNQTTINNNNTVVISDSPEANIDRLPPNVYQFEFNHKENSLLDLGYIKVNFQEVSAYLVRYTLED